MLELAVIGLDPVVGIPLDVVPCGRDQLVEHGRVDRRRVGDDLGRRYLQRGQCPAEEPAGRGGVTSDRDKYVDDLPILVDGR